MTDITELAQSLKAAAEKSGVEQWVNNRGEVNTADYEVDGGTYIDHICDCEIVGTESPRAEFISLANPANILALVEALEKARQRIDSQREYYEGVIADGVKRIAELESSAVTVKLPQRLQQGDDGWYDWYVHSNDEGGYLKFDDVLAMLTAAGIKVEA